MSTLQRFLTSGQLGDLVPGVSRDFVRQRLGEPYDVSAQRKSEVWKYGPVELGFYKDRSAESGPPTLTFIGLYFRTPREHVPSQLAWSGWLPTAGTTVADFTNYFTTVPIEHSALVSEDGLEYLIISSGVRITFSQGKLDSIQLIARRKPKRRQLSVSVPDEIWKRIRKEALEDKVSMSELCSKWISEVCTGRKQG